MPLSAVCYGKAEEEVEEKDSRSQKEEVCVLAEGDTAATFLPLPAEIRTHFNNVHKYGECRT